MLEIEKIQGGKMLEIEMKNALEIEMKNAMERIWKIQKEVIEAETGMGVAEGELISYSDVIAHLFKVALKTIYIFPTETITASGRSLTFRIKDRFYNVLIEPESLLTPKKVSNDSR